MEQREGEALQVRTDSGLSLVAEGAAAAQGERVEIFVRPEAIRVGFEPGDVSGFENRLAGRVTSLLFNGANSRILVRDDRSGGEIDVALPQSGEFSKLDRDAFVHVGWSRAQSICFPTGS